MVKKRDKNIKLKIKKKVDKNKKVNISRALEKNFKKEYKHIKNFFEKKQKFVREQKEEKRIDKKLALPFGILFIVSIILSLFTFLNESWIAAVIFIIIMFSSLILFIIISKLSSRNNKDPLIDEIRRLSDKGNYMTDLDIILILLKKYKRLKVARLVSGFKIDRETVEEWINTLERHGLLKVRSPLFSSMEITIAEEKNKNRDNNVDNSLIEYGKKIS